ncbi:MAG: alpha/beta hydrolase [Sphingomonadales bacterium]|nr:alpha/beta hydrolase [Sphingomonadales bacterium]
MNLPTSDKRAVSDAGAGAADPRRAIAAGLRESTWMAPDGQPIRRIDGAPSAAAGHVRGSLLFLPGRGDCYEKYLEALGEWRAAGWHVTALDWRGQAGSGRAGADDNVGHIDDFATWIGDLRAFWAQWRASTPGPHVLIGHSMGGHLALRALAEGTVNPAATVLVAPMLGLHGIGLPTCLLLRVARMMAALGDPRRAAWADSEKPGFNPALRMKLLTHDADRYADDVFWRAARPELAMGPGSWGWVQAALTSIARLEAPGVLEAIATPVLLLGTRHDGLVRYKAIARAAARLPRGQLLAFGREARHEILREVDPVRSRALAAIDEFLGRNALDPDALARQPAA